MSPSTFSGARIGLRFNLIMLNLISTCGLLIILRKFLWSFLTCQIFLLVKDLNRMVTQPTLLVIVTRKKSWRTEVLPKCLREKKWKRGILCISIKCCEWFLQNIYMISSFLNKVFINFKWWFQFKLFYKRLKSVYVLKYVFLCFKAWLVMKWCSNH